MTLPILSIKDLKVTFRNDGKWMPVVHGISIDVAEGETVAIVGESGSGKSVTALSTMGLLDRRNARIEGEILFGGRDLLKLRDKDMKSVRGNEVAMIFQEPMTSLNPVLTVGKQISEVLMRHRHLGDDEARNETIQLLEKVRIPAAASRMNQYPHNFSGGMRQRVMIAMALACKPKLLIADEPTTALDVTIQAQILELINSLKAEEGMSVLFITHDMGVVAEVADRTVVMYRGNVVESDATEKVFLQQRHPYTRALLAAVPVLGSMNEFKNPVRFAIVDPESGRVEPAIEKASTVIDDGKPVLDVQGLSVRYDVRSGLFGKLLGRVHAVENVSFRINAGETLALVGESGCGKSTTGRAVLRLIESQEGRIQLENRDVTDLGSRELRSRRRAMQMVFQDPFASLNPRMRIRDSIMEPLMIHGVFDRKQAKQKVEKLLLEVGLDPSVGRRFPHEFSGGQRQRICIARALALEPRLIVADEAVSALDVSIKAQIVNLMLDLQERLRLSYLFISHDMAVVERVSHRVAVMYLGEIVEIGPRESVFGDPQHPYTKKLIAAVPIPDPAKRKLKASIEASELSNPMRHPDYVRPNRAYFSHGPDHIVQSWGGEWA